MARLNGVVSQVIGPVVDVKFEQTDADLPAIFDALEIAREDGNTLVLECQQHIGESTVRTIAMDSTDGLRRGMSVAATGAPIRVPVGTAVRGRLLNVTGDTIDGLPTLPKEAGDPIHKPAPKYEDLSTETEVLYTGIKVIDLIEPYAKGG